MNTILFIEPVFKERIWGGDALKKEFGYDIPSVHTGEAWVISGHINGDSRILNSKFKGMTLSSVFKKNKHLFNNIKDQKFPLLTKILDANDDLSVQVHPDDTYAKKNGGDLGKTECWYVLDAEKGAYIIYGHLAQNKEEFVRMIDENRWDELLNKQYVKKGDFIYVPSGTLHALGKGLLVLETQQSSDTTYRVYDYNRKDDKGNLRDLHLKEALEVTNVPHVERKIESKVFYVDASKITQFVSNSFFTVEKWDVQDVLDIDIRGFKLMSVIAGKGFINQKEIKKGEHFIILSDTKHIQLEGNMQLIVSYL